MGMTITEKILAKSAGKDIVKPDDVNWFMVGDKAKIIEGLEKLGELTIYDRTAYNDQDIIEAIGDAEIIFTNKTPFFPKLQFF